MFRLRSAADDSRTAPRRAQVVLRWIVQRGHLLATSSDKATWDAEDLDLFSWSLTAAEMAALSAV
jgi:diketogulonate reductase-like aldo/keto reductase